MEVKTAAYARHGGLEGRYVYLIGSQPARSQPELRRFVVEWAIDLTTSLLYTPSGDNVLCRVNTQIGELKSSLDSRAAVE